MSQISHPVRADGVDTRDRLLHVALRLFAEQGFAKTSIREISQVAGTNVAAIAYYFGDKAGLYRAAFFEPMSKARQMDPPRSDLPLREMLEEFYRCFLEPLKRGDVATQCVQLHFREMVDPVGVWNEVIDLEIRPQHDGLVSYLSEYLGAKPESVDLHRLAFAISGMAVHVFVGREVMTSIRPDCIDSTAAVDSMAARLAMYAEAMVNAERLLMERTAGKQPARLQSTRRQSSGLQSAKRQSAKLQPPTPRAAKSHSAPSASQAKTTWVKKV
ncbi:MAG: CerR family C-terminal domain-containing protein [Burkholderiaceae bacterium]|nr:CerR family C-terminal domain-containing protein [Burkholderiaceae bacterium]